MYAVFLCISARSRKIVFELEKMYMIQRQSCALEMSFCRHKSCSLCTDDA
jgi:hypothetical protein